MNILQNTIMVFAQVLDFLILIRVILSWIPRLPDNIFTRLLFDLTEPILAPIRNLINKSPFGGTGMILDFSPMIALIIINVVSSFLIGILV